MTPDLTVYSDLGTTGTLQLFVYQAGELVGVAVLHIKGTMFENSSEALLNLMQVTRTEPFEAFNDLIGE